MEREDDSYAPYLFHVTGKRLGTKDTKNRRYTSMEQAFLHIFNEFNENVAIKNRYASLSEAMEKWEENPMKKICKTCGKIIKDDEDYTLVNSGMPEELNNEYDSEEELYLKLVSGSVTNIKPELVLGAFMNYMNLELKPYSCQIHRIQMYFNEE